MERERLGSRLGFILLSAGCAIGCGNIWKFPWMTGQNGGGGFVLVYLLCLLILGLPAMSQASIVRMYHKLEKPGQKWHIHGYLALIGNICLMAFYTVVTGWMIYYFVQFLTGKTKDLGFVGMITNPTVNVVYLAVAVVVGFFILSFNLQSGLERVTKILMTILIILMLILAVRSILLPGAGKGLAFYLVPDFSKITPQVVVAAMNQAFFTLSLGIGSMAIFGSYLDKERSLMGESINIIALDTLVAIVAGLIIFPACFTYKLEVGAGPSLLFDTMATVFNNMVGGRFWGTLGWGRKKGSFICAIGMFLISLTTALGYSVLHFQPFAEGSAWLDFWDFIVSTNLLPIGALIFALFCCSDRFGWGWDNFIAEANAGKGMKVKGWMKPIFKYVVPIAVAVIYIIGLTSFQWK